MTTTDPIKWLTEIRGLDDALLESMGVQKVDHPGLGLAVAFPYREAGKPYAAKFRTIGKKFASTQGVSRGLYNADVLKDLADQPAVITEGEIDTLTVIQAGFERCVSVPDGWTEQGNKIDALRDAEKLLRKSPFVIVAGDNDKAGESLPKAIANLLDGHPVKYVTWPHGCKDANDVLVNFGEEAVAEAIRSAVLIDPPGGMITGFSDLPPMSDRRVLRIGIPEFDKRIAFEVGTLSIGTGTPGSGKSTFVVWAAHHVIRNEGLRVGLLAFESHPHQIRDHLSRLKTTWDWDKLPGPEREKLAADLDQNWRLVHRTYEEGSHHLGWLKDMVFTLAARDGCKLIIVDPWNELEHLPEPGESMTNYINFALQQMRMWAKKLEIHICLIAHPKKLRTDGKPHPPTGYDVADSAAFANKPALGFTVHQEERDGEEVVRLVTWKVRDRQLYGIHPGFSFFEFDESRMVYRPRMGS